MEKVVGIIAPPIYRVPPGKYGGTEQIVGGLVNDLEAKGIRVILYASGDSETSASEHVHTVEKSIGTMEEAKQNPALRQKLIAESLDVALRDIRSRRGEIDIIHNHFSPEPYVEYRWRQMEPDSKLPWVHTLHGRLDYPEFVQWASVYPGARYISISDSQRRHMPNANYLCTIPNGTRIPKFDVNLNPGNTLKFVGRMSPEKNPLGALAIAELAKRKIDFLAKVDPDDREWYEREVRPRLEASAYVGFNGEVTPDERDRQLEDAYALVAPIEWDEPFGLFVIEAMAAGTPVIANDRGEFRRIIVDGKTGFVCDALEGGRADVRAMAEKVDRIGEISRLACRAHVEANYTIELMVDRYIEAYSKMWALAA